MEVPFAFLMLAAILRLSLGDAILRNDFDGPAPDGAYRWAFQTEEGIYHEQRGFLRPASAGAPALVVEGQYQYTAPNGQVIHVLYRADENGFQPKILNQ